MGCDADEILGTESIFVKINYTRRRRHLRASADMTGAIHLYDWQRVILLRPLEEDDLFNTIKASEDNQCIHTTCAKNKRPNTS